MKKILIWDDMPLKNTGGPSGYCYNIHEYLKKNPNPQIDFLSDILKRQNKPLKAKCNKPILAESRFKNFLRKTFIYRCVVSILEKKAQLQYYLSGIYTKPYEFEIEKDTLNQYDFLHIHFIYDVNRIKTFFPNYKGKIILTSHCPCPWIDERISEGKQWMKILYHQLIKKECQSYQQADFLMFPCKEAREPYEKNTHIRKIFQRSEHKFFYVPSAINDVTIDESKMQHTSELGIPEDSFIISYIGRHCEVKGYDILKNIAPTLFRKHKNLYIICAGKGEIPPLEHPRWLELGFIDNAAEIHHQTDLYILPNRDTYFDLVTLEILRSQTIIAMSRTGGNKYFEKFPEKETSGIRFFDIEDEEILITIVSNLINLKKKDPERYKTICHNNRTLFLNKFTLDSFIPNYLDAINAL